MTCRDEILAAISAYERETGATTFTIADLLAHMESSSYSEATIRTHITSRMCADAPQNHAVVHDDLERVGRGTYRRKKPIAG